MRSVSRTLAEAPLREVLPLVAGGGLIGASFGAIAVSTGLPWWIPCLMSVVVFAGASQFMFVGILAAGGGPVAAVIAGVILNARHLPFGLALGPALGSGRLSRALGSHILIDESTAFALAEREPKRAKVAYWTSGIGMFVFWNTGTIIGALGGQIITDTDALGLDAAFPAALLALVLPGLRDRPTLRAAAVGATIAVATTPFVPGGVNVLLSLVGLAATWPTRRDRSSKPGHDLVKQEETQ